MSVESLITAAQGYATNTINSATTALTDASNLVRAIGYSIPAYIPATLPSQPAAMVDLTMPALDNIDLNLPDEPGAAPAFQDISEIVPGIAPVLTAVAPTITLPTQPAQAGEFTDAAPVINTSFAFPAPADALMHPLIDAPVLPDRAEPTAPSISVPVFSAVAPTDDTAQPTDLAGTLDSAYRGASPQMITMIEGQVDAMMAKYSPRYAEQMGRIETQLARYLDGGTALAPAVETAIYERSRGKADAEYRRVRDLTYDEAADRGFTLPNGALQSALQQARQAGADTLAAAAREIVVQQAEMEQKNLQFAVTTSANLRVSLLSAAMNYHQNLISINGQALDYAKSLLGTIVETYNIAVKAFNVKLDAYKAEAAVYETRLKSAMAAAELYQEEIKALEAMTQVDRARVDVYRARIESLNAYASVYRSQIDAVLGQASLEKMKIELFRSRVEAYSAKVQGKNAEWQGYVAAISGETAKAQLFRSQVDGFNAQVLGYKTDIEAKAEVVRAQALTNQSRASQYQSTLAGYTAVVNARGEVARTELENERQKVVAFSAQSTANIAKANYGMEYYRATSLVAIRNAELHMTAMVQGADSQRAYGSSIAQIGLGSATVYSGLAAAAMSGMNSLSAQTLTE